MLNNILEQIGIDNYIYLSILLFCIGALGVLFRRSTIVMLMSVELMLAAANMLLAVFSVYHPCWCITNKFGSGIELTTY